MKNLINLIPLVFFLIFNSYTSNKEAQKSETEKDYIFFIHNKFLEENPDGTFADKYNVTVDYKGILN